MLTPQTVLIISTEEKNRKELECAFHKYGLSTAHSETVTVAKKLIHSEPFAAIFCEENLTDGSFREVIEEVSSSRMGTPVIIISSCGNWDACVAAMAAGAFDYIGLPVNPEQIERILLMVLDRAGDYENHLAMVAG